MIEVIAASLKKVVHPRFFETERGFQGELLATLRGALPAVGLPGDAIVEQKYQKRLQEHEITVRPDIIVHVPTAAGANRRERNFAVLELKRMASESGARGDFASLDAVLGALDYPLGVFVNIAGNSTHVDQYSGPFPERIHCFSVQLTREGVLIRHETPDWRTSLKKRKRRPTAR